jgi:imidazolonepropionase-like amidohydrolase
MTRILFKNANVFDGTTPHLLEGHHVVVEDGLVRELSSHPIDGDADTVVNVAGRTLMPGLIDLHVHIWAADMNLTTLSELPTEYIALFAAGTLQRSLDRGFTTLRDAGGTDLGYARAIERGFIKAPRFYHSGRFISQTGGHGDFRSAFEQSFAECPCCPAPQARFTSVADGVDSVRKAVREEFRRGARQVKLMCSGGVASPTDPVDKLQFTDAEILAAVEEADMRGLYIFAHCHPDIAIRRAAALGVRCIEHASLITAETARFLAEKGTYVVPTMAVAKALNDDGPKFGLPAVSMQKLAGMYEAMLQGLRYMKDAGVKMGFGTDLLAQHQDRQCTEFGIRASVLPAYDILISATSVAAEILMEEGRLGAIAPGAYADILVVDGDPLKDVTVLGHDGATLPIIMKAGEFHKRTI